MAVVDPNPAVPRSWPTTEGTGSGLPAFDSQVVIADNGQAMLVVKPGSDINVQRLVGVASIGGGRRFAIVMGDS